MIAVPVHMVDPLLQSHLIAALGHNFIQIYMKFCPGALLR